MKERGIVYSVGEERSGARWRAREIVIKQPGARWDNYLPLKLSGDMVDSCPSVGSEIEVEFYLNGRLGTGTYEGRCFVDLAVKSISVLSGQSPNSEYGTDEPF